MLLLMFGSAIKMVRNLSALAVLLIPSFKGPIDEARKIRSSPFSLIDTLHGTNTIETESASSFCIFILFHLIDVLNSFVVTRLLRIKSSVFVRLSVFGFAFSFRFVTTIFVMAFRATTD